MKTKQIFPITEDNMDDDKHAYENFLHILSIRNGTEFKVFHTYFVNWQLELYNFQLIINI